MDEEFVIKVRCTYDPKSKTIKCLVDDDDWEKIESSGGIKQVIISGEEEKTKG